MKAIYWIRLIEGLVVIVAVFCPPLVRWLDRRNTIVRNLTAAGVLAALDALLVFVAAGERGSKFLLVMSLFAAGSCLTIFFLVKSLIQAIRKSPKDMHSKRDILQSAFWLAFAFSVAQYAGSTQF